MPLVEVAEAVAEVEDVAVAGCPVEVEACLVAGVLPIARRR